jgi:signal transduction histidine kinase/ligand-binding sensor domain-containing protein
MTTCAGNQSDRKRTTAASFRAPSSRSLAGVFLLGALFLLLSLKGARALAPEELITQLAHSSWGAKEGIVNVEAIAQTRDGYLWVGTADGLFRFDGVSFTRWQQKGREPVPISRVGVLCAGSDGSLWIGSNDGVSRLQAGTLTHYTAAQGLPPGEVTSMLAGRNGSLWVATAKGLAKFSSGRWNLLGKENGLPEGGVRLELEDRGGNLWIAVDDPAVAGGTLLAFLRPGEKNFELTAEHLGTVATVCEAPAGQLWVADSSSSVRPFRPGAQAIPMAGLPLQSKAILFDRDGTFWIGTLGKGLCRTSDDPPMPLAGANSLRDRYSEKDGLSSDLVACALEDREGNIWFGTAAGLDCFRNNKIVSLSVAEGLTFDQRLMVAASADGAIWAGSEQGLQRLTGRQVETLGFEWIGPGLVNGLYSLSVEPSGDVWIGALNGVGHIQGNTHSPVEIAGGMEFRNVTAITRDRAGGLWLCDQLRGVSRVVDGKPRIFPAGPQLSAQTVNAALTDASGRVWLGFQDGSVSVYEEGQFRAYAVPQSVTALFCDQAGRIWAAGPGGLSRFQTNHFETLTTLNGLPSTELSGILEDDDGRFWLAGHSAIIRVDATELDKAFADPSYRLQCDAYGAADGLRGFPRQGRPFPVAAKARDGRLWFATTAGLAVVDPRHIRRNTNAPPVYVVQAKADGRTVELAGDVQLPAGTKDIKINYTALSFVDPERIQFRCKLDGYDENWHDASNLRQASYSNLRPQAYNFHVIACNNDGVWAETGASWKFSIRPAIYQTYWFLTLSAAAFAFSLWGLYRWNLARVTGQTEARMNARLEAQMAERKRIAQELHDTLLQGFTGVRLKLWAIAHQLPEPMAQARDQLNNVIRQTDQCLAESRRSIWALRSQRLEDAEDLGSALAAAVKQLVADTRLQLDLKLTGDQRKLSGIVEFNLLRICEEAAANAIKHADARKISVELRFEPHQVVLLVEDDGQGFDPDTAQASNGDHFGLAGMRDRAKIIGGVLTISSQPGAHTRMAVSVPG